MSSEMNRMIGLCGEIDPHKTYTQDNLFLNKSTREDLDLLTASRAGYYIVLPHDKSAFLGIHLPDDTAMQVNLRTKITQNENIRENKDYYNKIKNKLKEYNNKILGNKKIISGLLVVVGDVTNDNNANNCTQIYYRDTDGMVFSRYLMDASTNNWSPWQIMLTDIYADILFILNNNSHVLFSRKSVKRTLDKNMGEILNSNSVVDKTRLKRVYDSLYRGVLNVADYSSTNNPTLNSINGTRSGSTYDYILKDNAVLKIGPVNISYRNTSSNNIKSNSIIITSDEIVFGGRAKRAIINKDNTDTSLTPDLFLNKPTNPPYILSANTAKTKTINDNIYINDNTHLNAGEYIDWENMNFDNTISFNDIILENGIYPLNYFHDVNIDKITDDKYTRLTGITKALSGHQSINLSGNNSLIKLNINDIDIKAEINEDILNRGDTILLNYKIGSLQTAKISIK